MMGQLSSKIIINGQIGWQTSLAAMSYDLCRLKSQFHIYSPCFNAHIALSFNWFLIVKALWALWISRSFVDSSSGSCAPSAIWIHRTPARIRMETEIAFLGIQIGGYLQSISIPRSTVPTNHRKRQSACWPPYVLVLSIVSVIIFHQKRWLIIAAVSSGWPVRWWNS